VHTAAAAGGSTVQARRGETKEGWSIMPASLGTVVSPWCRTHTRDRLVQANLVHLKYSRTQVGFQHTCFPPAAAPHDAAASTS
jgi:hypothetical protein